MFQKTPTGPVSIIKTPFERAVPASRRSTGFLTPNGRQTRCKEANIQTDVREMHSEDAEDARSCGNSGVERSGGNYLARLDDNLSVG